MEAHRLMEGASYGPDMLKVLYQAFDEAWSTLAPRYGDDQAAIAAARVKLAKIVLALARDDNRDIAGLRNEALQRYESAPGDL
jgi:hypothetical protein